MRFIYDTDIYWYGKKITQYDCSDETFSYSENTYNVEDTQDNIIWLINSQEAYEEMERYYEKC